ncbi:hypothetical protein RDWZM_007510 [Blomia tropicalis]|uniref:PID domain-containing protein n=1 Tax=Blomia tropicalis TaxID=40697 RepID=A0A9Q0RI26_BLOTA|nr:hypothetical protein RDWZM_007510 [Blomia tropicalis]
MAKSVNGGPEENAGENDATTPICRCRVLYLGSSVPHITKDGLQGIQEPLRDLYPEQGVFWNADRDHSATGIDSWLSVWSNGILVENVDNKGNTVRRFHPIESLHYCAAIRYVSCSDSKEAKFLPLDSPFSKSIGAESGHPPLFACILRRTSGIKVLECHAFICKKEPAANALVQSCFCAYSDTNFARQIQEESPYEQLDKRRSRSIGSALDSQSLIDEKVNSWQKNSTGGSSSGTAVDNRSISRQNRTPSMVSLVSHHQVDHNNGGMVVGIPPQQPMEPIYYNGNGTLRSVRSFISLATLKSQKKMRPRQIPMPMSPPPPPPPVMFATLSKKELKKVLKKESTLKRKHKYKDMPPGAFLAPGPFPIMYGPGPPMSPHGMPIYAPLPPPVSGPYYTLDNRKGRMASQVPPPPPPSMHPHHHHHHHMQQPSPPSNHMIPSHDGSHHMLPPPSMVEEPIYMPAMSSPNGTLRPVTPHGEPIYFDGRNGPPMPMPIHQMHHGPPMAHPHMAPPPMFIQHPQTGNLVPCTIVPTLSRKEMEKQKALMKKAAKKEKKKQKNGKIPIPVEADIYGERGGYPMPNEIVLPPPDHCDGMPMLPPDEHDHPHSSYNSSTSGIYKKKGHLNERAFSYSIRQEHRSRSNSLSNLAFDNVPPVNGNAGSGGGGGNGVASRNGDVEAASNHASSVSLKSTDTGNNNMKPQSHSTYNGSNIEYVHNGMEPNGKPYMNGNGRMISNGSMHVPNDGIDPNVLATRMSNLKLNGNGMSHLHQHSNSHVHQHQHPPPPPPLPPNGYNNHNYQKTATIKRL